MAKITSIIDGSNRFVFLLTCSIPNLHRKILYLKPDGFLLSVGMHLRHKGSSKRSFTELVELIVDESEEDATFANTCIPHDDDLYLRQVLVHYIK